MQSAAEILKANSGSGLLAKYDEVRGFTQVLVGPLSVEDQMVQSMPDASPAKWHLAHTTWFFETFLLSEFVPGYQPFDPEFRILYNSYYKQLGKHPLRSTRGGFSRPSFETVLQYRDHVDERMRNLLANGVPPELSGLVELGLNHEQQHQELIVTDIKHAFWSQPLRPVYRSQKFSSQNAADLRWHRFPGGTVEIGHSGSSFSFDNESPKHEVLLRPFRLASRLVTNAEYLEFIKDGGYRRPELWLSDGWDTVCQQAWEAPLYWESEGDRCRFFTLAGMRDVEPTEPVCHVSYYEADAYARWAGARLPLEAEWEIAAASAPIEGNLAESLHFHPSAASSGDGISQMFGDLWEWTASSYIAYPGFRPAAGAVGEYNGKFMCNQFVLRGGSCATPQSHIRASYRNFFPPHARWQFTGIRLASDEC